MTRAADANIKRCLMCGAWVNKLDICGPCYRVYDRRVVQRYRDKVIAQVLKRA